MTEKITGRMVTDKLRAEALELLADWQDALINGTRVDEHAAGHALAELVRGLFNIPTIDMDAAVDARQGR